MKNLFSMIVGNRSLTERLSRDVANNTVNHAMIFEGGVGSGRHTIAKCLAAALSCRDKDNRPCGKCVACEKIFSGRSPDIITVGAVGDRTTIGVDSIRFLKNDIYVAPNDLDVKLYVIENADKMTVQAQNAFLLSLEEPPPYVIFVLICNSASLLLETVRSRAPIYRTERLGRDEIRDYIIKNDKRARDLQAASEHDLSDLISAASGSIGRAIALLDPKERARAFANIRTARNFISLSSTRRAEKAFEMLSELGSKRAEVTERLGYVQYALRDLILLKKSDECELTLYYDREEAAELSTHFTSEKLFLLYDAVTSAIDSLNRNANVRLVLTDMVLRAGLI